MAGHNIRLGKLEFEIIKAVWARGQATVHDVQEELAATHRRAYSTILTMMRKLETKGYLAHEMRDRTYIYRALISRDEVRRSALADIVERIFDGSAQLMVSGLFDYRKLSKKELDAIQKLVAERRRGHDSAE